MKHFYLWGVLAAVSILAEVFVGISLDAYAHAGKKAAIFIVNVLTLGIFLYLSLRQYKQQNDGLISFGRCMFNGILVSIVTGIIVAIGSFVYFNYINEPERERIIAESEEYIVKEKDSSSATIEQYRTNFVKSYRDTVKVTQADFPLIDSMASDSAKKMHHTLDRVKSSFSFMGQLIQYTIQYIVVGIILAVLIAAVIANKRA